MSAHGPDADGFEKATNSKDEPLKLKDTMAFMFESRYIIRPTQFALETDVLQKDYYKCWQDLEKKFRK
jgi:homogentisate 1,2-dioxygenase